MIEIKRVDKAYAVGRGRVSALSNVSFSVKKGEFLSIVGPSGCGKSTLLKIIGDIIQPSSGEVLVDGRPTHEARLRQLFGYVFQNPVLLPWRRVIDNTRLPGEVLKRPTRDAYELLQTVGLGDAASLFPHQLSGGMQQRVALARALTYDPSVLLLDEPFGAVDDFTRHSLNTELLRLWSMVAATTLLITHNIGEAVYLSDRVVILTRRPGSVRAIVPIPFPRPRDESLKYSKPFSDIVQCIRNHLEYAQ